MQKLRFLMDKFVTDYNYHLEQLDKDMQILKHSHRRMEEE